MSRIKAFLGEKMIATLDRLMTLSQKLRDAQRTQERDPIYLALDINEIRLLERTLEVYLSELDLAEERPSAGAYD
jgi:hypothetical protein